MSQARMDVVGGKNRRMVWGRRDEEFIADFTLVSQRMLTTEEHQLFRFHYLLGADWKLCCRRLKMDRGDFFHEVYRIQEKLGRIYRELEPYALFPLDEYFGGATRNELSLESSNVYHFPDQPDRNRLTPPLRKVA